MLNLWRPEGAIALIGIFVLLLIVFVCILVNAKAEEIRAWAEQQERLSRQQASRLAEDCSWASLVEEVKNLPPVDSIEDASW